MEIVVGFIVGVLSNLLTNVIWEAWVLKRLGRPPKRPGKEDFKRWFEVIGWGILPILFPLSALMLVQYRWPLSWLGKFALLTGSFLIAITVVTGLRYISLHWSPRQIIVALITIGLGGGMAAFYLLDQQLPYFVALDCPSKVETMTTLQGRILDPRWRVYVLVLPRRGGGAWVNRASAPGEDGTWYATCSFGGGDGEKFEVNALALPPELAQTLKGDAPLPSPEWLENNAPHKTSICVVTKQEL